MKYTIFIVHSFLCTYLLAHAMEQKKGNIPNIAELVDIKDIKHVEFLTDDNIIAAGTGGCGIINWKTKEVKKITDDPSYYLAVHSHKDKIALCNKFYIAIYDMVTGDKKWEKKEKSNIDKCVFNELDNSIFVSRLGASRIKKYDYVTDTYVSIKLKHLSDFSINVTNQSLAILNHFNRLFFYKFDNVTLPFKEIDSLPASYKCKYNSEGSMIAVFNVQCVCLTNLKVKDNDTIIIPLKKYENIEDINYLNNSVIGVSTGQYRVYNKQCYYESILRYYEILTKKRLSKNKWLLPQPGARFYLKSPMFNFSFSPNKTKVAVVFDGKCIIVPISFEAIYESDIKERFPFFLFVLAQLKKEKELPQDVIGHCANILWNIFKRQ